jgi:hypothetical protein
MTTTFVRTTAATIGLGALLAGGIAAGQAFGATPAAPSGVTAATTTAPDARLAAALAFARDEERMARDLYAAIADRYDGARPFSMITTSEQQHFAAIGALLERYGVTDPATGHDPGSYADAAVQSLYDGWWAEAQVSLADAYRVGIALEQRDIADLEKSLAGDLPADVDTVLTRLLQASTMHLSAFQAAADGDLGSAAGTAARGRGGMMAGRGGAGSFAMMGGSGNGAGYGARNGAGNGTGDCPFMDDGDE